MAGLVPHVAFGIVAAVLLPHLPEDFEPADAQAAQGVGVAVAFFAFLLIVRLGPGALGATAIGPHVDRRSQDGIAGAAEDDAPGLPGPLRHRGGAGQAL